MQFEFVSARSTASAAITTTGVTNTERRCDCHGVAVTVTAAQVDHSQKHAITISGSTSLCHRSLFCSLSAGYAPAEDRPSDVRASLLFENVIGFEAICKELTQALKRSVVRADTAKLRTSNTAWLTSGTVAVQIVEALTSLDQLRWKSTWGGLDTVTVVSRGRAQTRVHHLRAWLQRREAAVLRQPRFRSNCGSWAAATLRSLT